jgi:hypothetical protein
MKRRGLDERVLQQVLRSPEARGTVRPGRDVFQSRIAVAGRTYLLRAFVDLERQPPEVVTVYRTSKVEKYVGGPDRESHL